MSPTHYDKELMCSYTCWCLAREAERMVTIPCIAIFLLWTRNLKAQDQHLPPAGPLLLASTIHVLFKSILTDNISTPWCIYSSLGNRPQLKWTFSLNVQGFSFLKVLLCFPPDWFAVSGLLQLLGSRSTISGKDSRHCLLRAFLLQHGTGTPLLL